jgi:3'-5' exonuclease
MLKTKKMPHLAWAFDAEWVPDVASAKILYALPDTITDEEVLHTIWKKFGATHEHPRPYIKPILSRIVSVSVLVRKESFDSSHAQLELFSLPSVEQVSASDILPQEKEILARFLQGVGKSKPCLVGFNSHSADLRVFTQRAFINGVQCEDFCTRPDKPWEGIDYFSKDSEYNLDMFQLFARYERNGPSLHELAELSGIPGKIDVAGDQIVDLWQQGNIKKIVEYNECDSLTTYLVWLRLCFFTGILSKKAYEEEQDLLKNLLVSKQEHKHLQNYLDIWSSKRKD